MHQDWKIAGLASGECIYTYPSGTRSISEHWAPSVSPAGEGGVLVRDGACSSGGAPILLCLELVWGFFALPFWQGRKPFGWFWRTIAGCLSITALTFLWSENTTPHIISSRTSARGVSIRCCISSIVACETPPLAILAIFNERYMSDCSNCARPLSLAIVAVMLKTYKKLVAARKNEIWLLPLQPSTPLHSLRFLKSVLSTCGIAYDTIVLWKSQNCHHYDVQLHGLCGTMPWSAMEFPTMGSDI